MRPLTPTEDIRAARHKLAARFDNDLDRIVADLRRQEEESSAEFVTLGSRRPVDAAVSTAAGSGGEASQGGESTPSAR